MQKFCRALRHKPKAYAVAAHTCHDHGQVVLIAHSQGTIIASNALEDLWEAVDNKKLPEASLGNARYRQTDKIV